MDPRSRECRQMRFPLVSPFSKGGLRGISDGRRAQIPPNPPLKKGGTTRKVPEYENPTVTLAGMTMMLVVMTTTAIPASATCLVSVSDLQAWRAKPQLLVVDTRRAGEFEDLRIAGSVNVPPFALVTKRFLRDRPLLLVGDVAGEKRLVDRCEQMHAAGFAEVGVLEGGLRTWSRHVGRPIGESSANHALGRVAAKDLEQGDRWLVIDTSSSASPAEREVAGRLLRVPLHDEATFRASVERAVRKQSRFGEAPFVVLADTDGSRVGELQGIADELDVPYAFVLEDGLASLRSFRTKQAKIAASAARGCTLGRCGQ